VLEHVLELPPRSREEVQGDERAAVVEWDEMKGGEVGRGDDLLHIEVEQPEPVSPLPSFPRGRGVRLLSLAPYDILFQAGDEASSLYVVATGSLQAISTPSSPSSPPVVLGQIQPGSVCGGISFIGSTPRGETIRASSTPTTVYEYTRECIESLLSDDPSSLIPIARAVGRQLAPICQQVTPSAAHLTLSLVTIHHTTLCSCS
jgi:CRP-like cAMP-binding protein